MFPIYSPICLLNGCLVFQPGPPTVYFPHPAVGRRAFQDLLWSWYNEPLHSQTITVLTDSSLTCHWVNTDWRPFQLPCGLLQDFLSFFNSLTVTLSRSWLILGKGPEWPDVWGAPAGWAPGVSWARASGLCPDAAETRRFYPLQGLSSA